MKTTNRSVYIPSIDAKDLYLTNHYNSPSATGYNLKKKTGEYNLKKFINTLDYSLDMIVLQEIYYSVYRRNRFTFYRNEKPFSTQVINVTFSFAVKEFNMVYGDTYILNGYNVNELEFKDCISFNEQGELVGVQVNTDVLVPVDVSLLGKQFAIETIQVHPQSKDVVYQYKAKTSIKTLLSSAMLRVELYEKGFYCDGIHYVRWKRTSGSARVGKCLFINEALYNKMHKVDCCGLDVKDGQEIDLAAFESYISLSTSSIIDTLQLLPKNILVIDDYNSIFQDNVVLVEEIEGKLRAQEKTTTIKNSIWDGLSLIDESALGVYDKKGMVLLRNFFFKSCCFNTKLQQWFKDNNITRVSQLKGFTLAENIEDIKLITTPSSIKYLKFGSLEQWLSIISTNYGIVKYEKPTHYFNGRLVSTHYQLLNTLQLTESEVEQLLSYSLQFIKLLRSDPAVVRYYVKYKEEDEINNTPTASMSDIVYKLLGINDKFAKTKYYQEFLNDIIASFTSDIKRGHVLVNGNYSTLLGNPVEMLMSAIGTFNGISQMEQNTIHTKRFDYGKMLLGSRSPHVCFGNVWLPVNKDNELIEKYINLTNEIVCINAINDNVLNRLSGCDYDSDTAMFTDNSILIQAALRNYDKFRVPVSCVESKKTKRYYTRAQQADLDIKTSINKIGEIINYSQILNSLYWNNLSLGMTHEENAELYQDICILDIMSGIEIDKAKKEFVVNNEKELLDLKAKYKNYITDNTTGQIVKPDFFKHVDKMKGYYVAGNKLYKKHETTMDYIQCIVSKFRYKTVKLRTYEPFVSILDNNKYYVSHVTDTIINNIICSIRIYNRKRKEIWSRSNVSHEEQLAMVQQQKEKCLSIIDKNVIGYSNIYKLLSLMDDAEYSDIYGQLLNILFRTANTNFFTAIKDSQEEIEVLIEDFEQGNVNIFGIPYSKHTKKSLNPLFDDDNQ